MEVPGIGDLGEQIQWGPNPAVFLPPLGVASVIPDDHNAQPQQVGV